MRLCNDTITVFNKRASNGDYIYVPTVISGVSWYGSTISTLTDKGLSAANQYTVRIPVDADSGGKEYADPVAYTDSEIISGMFTLAQGDIIVKAAIDTEGLRPAQLKEMCPDFMTVLGVTDNRRAPNAPHFRVVGR